MTPAELIAVLRRDRLAVVSTVADDGAPQGAVVGFAVSDDLEIVFDTLASTARPDQKSRLSTTLSEGSS